MDSYPGNKTDVSGTILEPPPGLDPDCLLFLGDPELRTTSTFARVWMPLTGALSLGIGSVVASLGSRFPVKAAFHRHVINTLIGFAAGEGGWRLKQNHQSERDIQYFHYMVLHPEDFQAPERKKWGEVLKPWIPMR